MMPSRRGSVGVLGISLFLVAGIQTAVNACAQSPDSSSPIRLIPRTKEEREQRYQAHHLITLIAQVTDSSGKPVTGLKANDFSVLDNQKQSKTASFHEFAGQASTANLHVMLVLDAINDGGSSIGHVKKDLDKFLAQDGGPLAFPLELVYASGAEKPDHSPPRTVRRLPGNLRSLRDARARRVAIKRTSMRAAAWLGSRWIPHRPGIRRKNERIA